MIAGIAVPQDFAHDLNDFGSFFRKHSKALCFRGRQTVEVILHYAILFIRSRLARTSTAYAV